MRKFFNKYIIIILSFYAFWILGIPLIFSQLFPVVCNELSKKTNLEIKVENPMLQLSVIPTATFKAKKLSIKEKSTGDNFGIEDAKAVIRILPLISGRVHINNFYASNLDMNITLNQKIVLDKNFFDSLSTSKFIIDELYVDKSKISIYQEAIKDTFLYSIKKLSYKNSLRALMLDLSSELMINKMSSKSDITLYLPKDNDLKKSNVRFVLENLDVARVGYFFKNYLPKDFVSMKGLINVKADKQNLNIMFNDFALQMQDDAKSIVFPKELSIDSLFNITTKLIQFDNINVKSNKISAILDGKILNYMKPSLSEIDFNVRLNKSRVEDIVNLLPPIIVEEFNVYKLKHYKFYGDAFGHFSIKGNVLEPEINGDVIINNGILIEPIKNAKGATIKLNFIGKYLNFDVEVPAGLGEYVWVKGGVELYNVKYSDMRIWSTKNVNLATAEAKVIPLHEILNFVVGPVPIMDISGFGNIDIKVKGNRQNPFIWGYLNFRNVTTSFKEIPDMVLTRAKAILTFDDQNAHFETKEGFVNNKPFKISGDCNLLGKFDFDVESSNQDLSYFYKALETATMIDEIKNMLPKVDVVKGLVNLKLKVYGSLIDIDDICFNQNVFSKGSIELLGNTFGVQGITVNQVKGIINFEGTSANTELKAKVGNADMKLNVDINDDIADVVLNIPNLNLADILLNKKKYIDENSSLLLDVSARYKGKINDIEYDKIDAVTKVIGGTFFNRFRFNDGFIAIKNGKARISNLKGNVIGSNGVFSADVDIENINKKPSANGLIKLKDFDLSSLNILNDIKFIPKDYKVFKFDKGKVNVNCRIKDNKVNSYMDLGGVNLTYIPINLPITIINGSLIVRNNNLKLNKLNMLVDAMPILIHGQVYNIFDKQNFNIYMNSKPKQEFIDKYFNKNQIYPLKIKGDIVYSLKLKGNKDDFDLKADVNMAKDSSIYHLGAIVGDVENSIVLNLDTRILNGNTFNIKEFSYDKIIPSLGTKQTRLNMLKAKGGIEVLSDDLVFDDLYVKTQNPTDARIFNIIFRKPNIKQGQFTSDLKFNGKLSDPKLIGDFHIFETNIPFLDTTMKNIVFKFRDKNIELSSKGEILGNDITIHSTMKNKLSIPYYVEKADLYTNVLDLNYIINKLKLSQVDEYSTLASFEGLDIGSIIIKSLNLKADNIYLKNIEAKDFVANLSYDKNRLLRVNNFDLNIANGALLGNLNYNMNNSHTDLNLKAKDIDANALTYALFDLDKQIYGDMTGDISLSCSAPNFEKCMQTLEGKTTFNVIQGRLPKLGSLEYLLKAGNLVKGGITSVSINNIIDLITPLKTGDFSSIYGVISIKDGIADNIEIGTKGKDLNLYISGNYNFATADAQMEVLGLLSKKISTMFGPIGNLSLNTLFSAIPGIDLSKDSKLLERINKIPGIEISSKDFRKFVAEIKGNINGEDYVTSFKWIN